LTHYPFELTDPRLNSPLPFIMAVNRIERHFPAHRHDFLEVSLVIEGSGEESVNGTVHKMEPGTLTMVLPFHIHELRAAPGTPLRLFNCMFSPEMLSGGMELERLKNRLLGDDGGRSSFVQLAGDSREQLTGLFRELMEEYEGGHELRHAMLRVKLAELMIRVERLRGGPPQQQETLQEQRDTPERIWRVLRHMHTHYREQLTLGGLADTFHFNRTYLSEQLAKHTGKSFLRLLHEIRLRHACSLLASSDMTVSAIAYEVGYGSSKTFFKAFLKYKGITPGAYREQAGERS
jgi:AraC-like DNA-binding protein